MWINSVFLLLNVYFFPVFLSVLILIKLYLNIFILSVFRNSFRLNLRIYFTYRAERAIITSHLKKSNFPFIYPRTSPTYMDNMGYLQLKMPA